MRRTNTARKNNANITVAVDNTTLAQTVMNNTYSICGKKLAAVPCSEMKYASYQRPVDKQNVNNIASEFDMNKCQFLTVSYRDDVFYVIDGQHRLEAARLRGIKTLPCIIFEGLTEKQEARMFATQHINVKKLHPISTYNANLVNGDTSIPEVFIDMQINRICTEHNISVVHVGRGKSNIPKLLRSLSAARNIINTNGVKSFEWIVDTICKTDWNESSQAFTGYTLKMMKYFYNENPCHYDYVTDAVIKVMQKYSPIELMGAARKDYPNYPTQTGLNICFKNLVAKELEG